MERVKSCKRDSVNRDYDIAIVTAPRGRAKFYDSRGFLSPMPFNQFRGNFLFLPIPFDLYEFLLLFFFFHRFEKALVSFISSILIFQVFFLFFFFSKRRTFFSLFLSNSSSVLSVNLKPWKIIIRFGEILSTFNRSI